MFITGFIIGAIFGFTVAAVLAVSANEDKRTKLKEGVMKNENQLDCQAEKQGFLA